MVLQQKGLTVLEAVITLCLIGVLFGVFVSIYPRMAREAQETALRSGLSNIRASIRLFRMLNGRDPRSLAELVEKEVLMPARVGADAPSGSVFQQKYLMERSVDKQGNIVDPFGNPFAYDPLRGEVKATTAGYENW